MKTRDSACGGCRRVLAAHQEVHPASSVDPYIAEMVERQTREMCDLSRCVVPEPEVSSDDQPTPLEAVRVERRRESEATRALALQRARAERAARQDMPAAGQLEGAAGAVELERTA
ncbi:hypothetical protein ACIRPX_45060 [Streptomyces sp. NPDC101225]|uniref:hypothetical protein n=1 Tax=Streptomyces sp. NPDC101225 TaxID=3366135 RepID=UPI0037F9EECD